MEMLAVQSIPMDERTHVDTGWGMIHNGHVELNAGFAHDPGTSAYEQMRGVCHSRDVAVGRLNAVYISIDCKPNIMESQAKGKYRDKQGKSLPGADGDLARSCDDQLLDVFRTVKRIAEEHELLIERRDRERERGQLDDAYGASTGDEAERHADVELEQQPSDDDNDGQDEPAAPTRHTSETEVTGHHGTTPGPQRFAPTSAVSGESEPLTSETAVTAFPPSACTDGASDGHMSDDASALIESATGGGGCSSGDHQGPVLPSDRDPIPICSETRMTGWCNGDAMRIDGSMTIVTAGTLGQMPHGR